MSDHYVPALRQRFLEDMQIKGLLPKTQTMYLRAMREFTRFLGHSPDTATSEELRAPNLLYRWRRLMPDGGAVAVSEDDDVTSNRAVRQMEDRICQAPWKTAPVLPQLRLLPGRAERHRSQSRGRPPKAKNGAADH